MLINKLVKIISANFFSFGTVVENLSLPNPPTSSISELEASRATIPAHLPSCICRLSLEIKNLNRYEKCNGAIMSCDYRCFQYSCSKITTDFFLPSQNLPGRRRRQGLGRPGQGFHRNDECKWGIYPSFHQPRPLAGIGTGQ